MPLEAKRSRDFCWLSPRVRAFKPLKIMGSTFRVMLEEAHLNIEVNRKLTVSDDN
jgi:hypothetical protein